MLIVYIAHPIGGDVARNMALVKQKCGEIFKYHPEVVPLAPYLLALKFLDDTDPTERVRGVSMNREFFSRKTIDELWLFGDRISNGMWEEVCWAREFGIPIMPMNRRLLKELVLRETKEGDIIQIGCDGPGGGPVTARLLSFLPGKEGVAIRNKHWKEPRLLYHHILWCDIAQFAPHGTPLFSSRRFA